MIGMMYPAQLGSNNTSDSIIDYSNPEEVNILSGPYGGTTGIQWSPNGTIFITTSFGDYSNEYFLNFWNASTMKEKITLNSNYKFLNAKWSPDGKYIVTSFHGLTFKVWDGITGKEIREITKPWSRIDTFSWSNDSRYLATGDSNKKVMIWDTLTWEHMYSTPSHSSYIKNIVFSSNNTKLFTVDTSANVKVWNLTSYELMTSYSIGGYTVGFGNAEFSPDRKTIVTSHSVGELNLWNSTDGSKIKVLKPFISTGFPTDRNVVWHAKSNLLYITNDYNGSISVWDPDTWVLSHKINTGEVSSTSISLDESGSKMLYYTNLRNIVKLENNFSDKTEISAHKDYINDIIWDPKDQYLASSSKDSTVKIWNLDPMTFKTTLSNHTGSVNTMISSSDGDLMYTGSTDDTIKIWNTSNWEIIDNIPAAENVISLHLNNDESQLIAGLYGNIKIWNTGNWEIINTITGFTRLIQLEISPDGRFASTVEYFPVTTVKIFDTSNWEMLASYDTGEYYGYISFSSDNKYLAHTNDNFEVKLINLDTLSVDKTYRAQSQGHSSTPYISFNPNTSILAIAYYNQGIELWNYTSHEYVGSIPFISELKYISWNANGSMLAASGRSFYQEYTKHFVSVWKFNEKIEEYITTSNTESNTDSDNTSNTESNTGSDNTSNIETDTSNNTFNDTTTPAITTVVPPAFLAPPFTLVIANIVLLGLIYRKSISSKLD